MPAWRWVFYLGAPAAVIALVWCWAALADWDRQHVPGHLDVLGAALVTVALASGLVALTTLGEPSGISGLPVTVIAAVILLIAVVGAILHARRTDDPFLDPRLFRDRIFRAAILVSLLTGYALATAIIGAAVWVDRVRYEVAPEQRLVLGSLALAMAIGAIGSGYLLRVVRVVPLGIVGLVLAIVGMGMLGVADSQTSMPVLLGALAVFGLGFGITVTPRSTAAIESLGRSAFGIASAGVTVARMAGMAVGLAVLTGFGSQRIESLSVVINDAAARDLVLPLELRGRPLGDLAVIEVLETWASAQAASILAGLFLVAAVVLLLAVWPTILMGAAPQDAEPATIPDDAAERPSGTFDVVA